MGLHACRRRCARSQRRHSRPPMHARPSIALHTRVVLGTAACVASRRPSGWPFAISALRSAMHAPSRMQWMGHPASAARASSSSTGKAVHAWCSTTVSPQRKVTRGSWMAELYVRFVMAFSDARPSFVLAPPLFPPGSLSSLLPGLVAWSARARTALDCPAPPTPRSMTMSVTLIHSHHSTRRAHGRSSLSSTAALSKSLLEIYYSK